MTAVVAAAPAVRVRVWASDPAVRAEVSARLAGVGAVLDGGSDPAPDAVAVAAGATAEDALAACPPAVRVGGGLVVVADVLSRSGVLRAVRAGVRVMLRTSEAIGVQLTAALDCTRQGDGRMPHEAMVGLLSGAGWEPAPAGPAPLTPRQSAVLALMAEGHGNAAIAKALSCSEHTVKNVIYDLMGRLQVRNRAHAVAHAVRSGLI